MPYTNQHRYVYGARGYQSGLSDWTQENSFDQQLSGINLLNDELFASTKKLNVAQHSLLKESASHALNLTRPKSSNIHRSRKVLNSSELISPVASTT
jgi:hypothetical protein